MGKPLEMYVLIFLQSMVQIRARNVGFTTKILFRFFCILSLGALVAESPQEGAIVQLVVWDKSGPQIYMAPPHPPTPSKRNAFYEIPKVLYK